MVKVGGSERDSGRVESGRSESGRSESERGSSKRGSERGDSNPEKKEEDEVTVDIPWEVSLAQFQVEGRVYRPKPVLWGPIMSTPVGPITLDWQLSLTQGRNDARVGLSHRTRGIPNLGVTYAIYLERKDGSKGKLTAGLRTALANSATKTTFPDPRAVLVKRYILAGDRIRIHALLRLSRKRFSPVAVVAAMILGERKTSSDYEDGVVGAKLWQQVVDGGTTESSLHVLGNDCYPKQADLVFDCPNGEKVFAHRSVIGAFSSRFREILEERPRAGRLVIGSSNVSAPALREVLHFVYLRRTSPNLYKANLGEVLEAARIFQQPALLKLEVEKLLVLVLDTSNAENLWKLAQVYGLHVLANLIISSANTQPGLKQRLIRIRRDLLATRAIPDPEPTERDSSIVV